MEWPWSEASPRPVAVFEEALLKSIEKVGDEIVGEYVNANTGELENVDGAAGQFVATIVTAHALLEVREHSHTLVRLTWALFGTTIVLSALTAVLLWRTLW